MGPFHSPVLTLSTGELAPLYIKGDTVERVTDFMFLGIYITQDFNTTMKKAQQQLCFLKTLWRMNLSQQLTLTLTLLQMLG